MARPFVVCAVLVIALLTITTAAQCEVIHGFQTLMPAYINAPHENPLPWDAGFDFSTQSLVDYMSEETNVYYGENIRGDGWHFHGTGVVEWVVTPFEDVHVAPTIPLDFTQNVTLDGTFVTKTDDGLYAKFAVREWDVGGCCSMKIEYSVQMDGSPSFDPFLPVRSSTWGGIKALYR